jgi:hypothetical protein
MQLKLWEEKRSKGDVCICVCTNKYGSTVTRKCEIPFLKYKYLFTEYPPIEVLCEKLSGSWHSSFGPIM